MRFLRIAILAIGLMGLASACGGKQKTAPAGPDNTANPCEAAAPGGGDPCGGDPCGGDPDKTDAPVTGGNPCGSW